jgi:hypothetical protein
LPVSGRNDNKEAIGAPSTPTRREDDRIRYPAHAVAARHDGCTPGGLVGAARYVHCVTSAGRIGRLNAPGDQRDPRSARCDTDDLRGSARGFARAPADQLYNNLLRKAAIEWSDGTGQYFLHGTEFDSDLYAKVINSRLIIQEIAALTNADQRSIALTYLTFEQLVIDSDSELLDTGVKGTSLYRLPLPPRIARDRVRGYGGYDYFIHMRDASHPEHEFIE